MLVAILCVLISLAVGYAYLREGLFTAFVMGCNVIVAGLVAFNFWEPIADAIEPVITGSFLQGYEDAFSLTLLFALTLGLLRLATNSLAPTEMVFPAALYRGGGFFFGMMTGYLVSGFLVCVLQTLPWHENFMFFDWKYDPLGQGAGVRRILPPDRVWLAMMYRAGAYTFANDLDVWFTGTPQTPADKYITFDKYGTFELRYARYRRYTDKSDPLPYGGEFDAELGKAPPG